MGRDFFCKIPFLEQNKLPVLITSNHVLEENDIKKNKIIEIKLNDERESRNIKIDKFRKRYTCSKIDLTIIEIRPKIDNLNHFLEIDEDIYKSKDIIDKIYRKKSLYLLHYPSDKIKVSYGLLNDITENNITHFCETQEDSSGLPILSLDTFKVIGVHYQSSNNLENQINKGFLIKHALDEFYEKNLKKTKDNEIKMVIKIEKKDLNKNIYFLDNTEYNENKNGKQIKHFHDNLKELNDSNIELYINNKRMKYQKYFNPKEEGNYSIKLIFKNSIKDCNHMFYNCYTLTQIDLSSFDTKNVINMEWMFPCCNNLSDLNLSSIDTKNVTNMSYMFSECINLTHIDLSSFNTKNVTNMSGMFSGCHNLTNLDLSSFDTRNVINMNGMFSNCKNLTNINLSSFDTKNIIDMIRMFSSCNSLTNLDLSSFELKNGIDIGWIFTNCKNLKNLKIKKQ